MSVMYPSILYKFYHCHCFPDTYIQKLRRQYSDQRGRRHLHQLREDLNDVQRIMMENIDDVLQRGTALSGMYKLREREREKKYCHFVGLVILQDTQSF